MFRSDGVLKGSPVTVWQGTPAQWQGWPTSTGFQWGAYGELYSKQLWVAVPVNKIAGATARLPLKVYERGTQGRVEAKSSPYAQLLANPSTLMDAQAFWRWTRSTLDLYGEAFWGKIRDRGGRPVELVPLHPTNVHDEQRDGKTYWEFRAGAKVYEMQRRDFVHFKHYNPASLIRGLSPLEPLRSTLENEDGARRANSALWRNGGQPSHTLEHPNTISAGAISRLREQWADIHGGVDNWAKPMILEEGMKATPVPLNVEQLQYIEARKLNREECCAAFDIPPPVVHILDRATFSNITEQMRSMYRDTMAPKLGHLEATMEFELRDGTFKSGDAPDFGADVYSEFLMDEVLRGSFEARVVAYQAAINGGWLTPAEVREMENRPFIKGSDVLMANSTLAPVAQLVEPAAMVSTAPPSAPPAAVRSLLGRLGRCKTLDDLDPAAVAPVALAEMVGQWKSAGATIEAVRASLAALMRSEER